MSDPLNLETRNYPAKRKRRSCFGSLLLLGLGLLGFLIIISLISAVAQNGSPFGEAVGVVRIEGPINESQKINRILKRFRESSRIKAVVLRLDTPGGAVGASEEIYREVLRLRAEKKPVIVSMGNAAASGGYYIAAGADEIYANAGTITGSIGVIAPGFNVQETMEKLGLRSVSIKSGEHKDTGSPFHQMTTEQRSLLQGLIFDAYRQFVTVILKGRHEAIAAALQKDPAAFDEIVATQRTKVPGAGIEWDAFTTGTVAAAAGATVETETALRRLADGRILTGDQAMRVGLVDKIGGLEDAVNRAGELAKITGDPKTVERKPESNFPAWLGGTARQAWDAFSQAGTRIEYRN